MNPATVSHLPHHPMELLRRLENVLRVGTIEQVDHGDARVRVRSGELLTTWLPWFEQRAGDVRTWCPPSIGEQCLLLSPSGDLAAGLVLVGLNSTAHPAPAAVSTVHRTVYPDGAVIDYDHAAHALNINLPAGSTTHITAPGSVTVTTPQTTITGECDIQGPLRVATQITTPTINADTANATAVNAANVVATSGVSSAGIPFNTHVHGNVRAGSEYSSGPQ